MMIMVQAAVLKGLFRDRAKEEKPLVYIYDYSITNEQKDGKD